MKNLKKWIIILGILILILIAVLIYILSQNSNEPGKIQIGVNKETVGEADISVDVETNITLEKDYNTFFSIEKNIQNYCLYLRVQNANALYNLITEEYINNNQITLENITNKLPKIESSEYEFKLKKLYISDDELYPVYYAYGELKINQKVDEQYYIVYTDRTSSSINLQPLTRQEYENIIQSNNKNTQRKIAKTNYNSLIQTTVSEEDVAKKYLKNYIYEAIHEQTKAYNSLEASYKSAKYASIQDYTQYINSKIKQLKSMDTYSIKKQEEFKTEEEYIDYMKQLQQKGLAQYAVTKKEEYTQYICIDDYGNNYIFRETSPMQYTVILDTYTIDLPEFIEKYNNSTEEEKVLLNIQKFFEAINNNDYEYAYSKLDETFKANNFGNVQQFENYSKQSFFAQNKLAAGRSQIQGNNYLYNVTITDMTGKNTNSVTKTFVMRLKEGTDFVMSFSK